MEPTQLTATAASAMTASIVARSIALFVLAGLIGSALCIVGVAVIMYWPRAA